MNKRIKEIITEAGMFHNSELYELAELIARECAQICIDEGIACSNSNNRERAVQSHRLAKLIETRFGV